MEHTERFLQLCRMVKGPPPKSGIDPDGHNQPSPLGSAKLMVESAWAARSPPCHGTLRSASRESSRPRLRPKIIPRSWGGPTLGTFLASQTGTAGLQ